MQKQAKYLVAGNVLTIAKISCGLFNFFFNIVLRLIKLMKPSHKILQLNYHYDTIYIVQKFDDIEISNKKLPIFIKFHLFLKKMDHAR